MERDAGVPLRPVVICGPSGVGKGTLIAKLMAEYPASFGFSVSHTTRSPRPGEVDGVHYHFAAKEAVLADVDAGLFLEHAHVFGNVYGTSLAAVKCVSETRKVCILDVDIQGAASVKRANVGAAFVFIAPPSMEALEERLRGRGTETEDKVKLRLAAAAAECAKAEDVGFFDVRIVNDDLDSTYAKLKAWLSANVVPLDAVT